MNETANSGPLPDPPGIACGYNPSSQWIYIYALIDPETNEIRYIGKSIRPYERLQNHMNEKSNCHRSHWLQQLKAKGLIPFLLILEQSRGGWPWQEAERYWIARGRREGWPLTNNTSGGDGVSDLSEDARQRLSKRFRGQKLSPEHCRKIGEKSKGRKHSEAHREKMRQIMTGRKILWVDKVAEANRKFTPELVVVIKQRLDAGERTGALAVEYSVHRTTISKIKMGTYNDRYRKSKSSD